MNRLQHTGAVIGILCLLQPLFSIGAWAAPGKEPVKVPITYPGDTNQTIARRAGWIEKAKGEGQVVWWASFRPDQVQRLFAEFNTIYPFISLNYWRGQDVERITRVEAGHAIGQVPVDFYGAGDITSYPRWRKLGLPEKYIDFIPGVEKWDTRMYSRHRDYASLGNNAVVPMYNTRLIPPGEAPKGWDDLLHPKWKGKIGMTSDVKVWYVLALGDGGWGVERTESFLQKLRQQELIWASGHSAGHNLLIAGEFHIMAEDYLRYIFETTKRGAPVDWVRANPALISGPTFVMPTKAPHPNAARLFVEWLFSPQGMVLVEQIIGTGAAFPGSGTRISQVLEGVPLVYRTEEVVLQATSMNLTNRFSKILGALPRED